MGNIFLYHDGKGRVPGHQLFGDSQMTKIFSMCKYIYILYVEIFMGTNGVEVDPWSSIQWGI